MALKCCRPAGFMHRDHERLITLLRTKVPGLPDDVRVQTVGHGWKLVDARSRGVGVFSDHPVAACAKGCEVRFTAHGVEVSPVVVRPV